MKARTPIAAVGVLAFAAALAIVASPGVGDAVPVESAIEDAGSDYLLLAAFGLLALLPTVGVAILRTVGGQDQARPPDPESIQTAPQPGAEFDALVADGVTLRERVFGDARERARERLRTAAARTVMRRRTIGREAATERVGAGDWTDDRVAAAFVAGPDGPSPPIAARIRAALTGRSWFQYGLERTAAEIARQAGVEPADATDDAAESDGPEPARPEEADVETTVGDRGTADRPPESGVAADGGDQP